MPNRSLLRLPLAFAAAAATASAAFACGPMGGSGPAASSPGGASLGENTSGRGGYDSAFKPEQMRMEYKVRAPAATGTAATTPARGGRPKTASNPAGTCRQGSPAIARSPEGQRRAGGTGRRRRKARCGVRSQIPRPDQSRLGGVERAALVRPDLRLRAAQVYSAELRSKRRDGHRPASDPESDWRRLR